MSANDRRDGVVLCLLVVIACMLRIAPLYLGVWRDEGSTYVDISAPTAAATLHEVRLAEISPPAYFLFMRVWVALAGTGEAMLRLPSLVFGLATVPATYALARLLGPRSAALLAAGFTASSTVAIGYSALARPYALAALLATVVTALALRVQTLERDRRTLAAYVATAVLLAYVHYTGVVLLAGLALGALPLLRAAQTRRCGLDFLAASAVVGLAYLPWLPVIFAVRQGSFSFLAPIRQGELVGRFIEQLGFALPVAFMHSQYATAFALACLVALFARDARRRSAALAVLAVTLFETRQHLHEARYMFALTPVVNGLLAAYCVALASPVAALLRTHVWQSRDLPRVIGALLLAASFGAGLSVQARAYEQCCGGYERSGMRRMVSEAGDLFGRRTLVVVAPDYLAPSLAYYVRGDVTVAGVPQWQHPAHPRCCGDDWRGPALVDDAFRRIVATATGRYERIALVWDTSAADEGEIPYSRALEVRSRLERAFPVVAEHRYAGFSEPVGLTVFRVPPRSSRPSR